MCKLYFCQVAMPVILGNHFSQTDIVVPFLTCRLQNLKPHLIVNQKLSITQDFLLRVHSYIFFLCSC